MINRMYVTVGDTEKVRRTLYDANGVINLTGATVKFRHGRRGSDTRTDETCTIVDAVNGIVDFNWAAAFTAPVVHVGRYVVTVGAVVTSVPNTPDQILVHVSPN